MSQGDARFGRLEDMEIYGDASGFCALRASPNPKLHVRGLEDEDMSGLGLREAGFGVSGV